MKSIALGDDSDNVRYDAAAKRLYVGYGSGALAAIDPADGKVMGQAKLAGHPESFQLERTGPRIFVNVPTAEHIAVVDRNAMKVTATWPVSGAKSNFPMALDESNHRLFVGCRKPAKVLVYDTTTGKEIGAFDIVGDTDDMFYDSQRKRLYVAGGEGFIDVLDASAPATLTRVARLPPLRARAPRCLPRAGAVSRRAAPRCAEGGDQGLRHSGLATVSTYVSVATPSCGSSRVLHATYTNHRKYPANPSRCASLRNVAASLKPLSSALMQKAADVGQRPAGPDFT